MKSTGIVRRIDDLGRIVIPRAVRREIQAKEDQPFEIFITPKGDILLKKYIPWSENEEEDDE